MQVYLWQICCWIQSHKYKTLYAGKEFAPKQLLIIITHMPRQPVEFHHSRAKKWLKGTKSERYLKLQKERVWSNRRYSSTKYDTALTSTVSLAMSNMSGRPGKMLHLISLGWFKYCLEALSAQVGPKSLALKQYNMPCANLGIRLSRQSDRNIQQINVTKGFSSASNLMGHEMAGCLLMKLFAMHTTYFHGIFAVGTKQKKAKGKQRLCSEKHIGDWILVVTSLLTWYQWMKQPTISKKQVKGSHAAVQWLMRIIATVAPRTGGTTNSKIKGHLVLHICEDILDHGVPDNVNHAYAESAHVTLANVTSGNTQKRAVLFTKQAAHRYIKNLVVSLASADVKNDIKLKDRLLGTCSAWDPTYRW